jgi:hypothetical protein
MKPALGEIDLYAPFNSALNCWMLGLILAGIAAYWFARSGKK